MMETTEPLPEEIVPNSFEELRAEIAARIRQDSEDRASLTAVGSLADFFEELTPKEAEPILIDLLNDARYADIKALMTSDDLFFYSTLYLEPTSAEAKVLDEEVMFRIATTVRQQSKSTARLTPITALGPVLSDLEVEDIGAMLPTLMEDARFQDIQQVTISTGQVFFYSKHYITENYAQLLARTEAGDPLATIAETVREESRIYPRPTNVLLFIEPPFNMKRAEIPELVAQLLAQEAYADIKKIVAPTGAVYLHSDRHLGSAHAKSLVEWEEVEQYENP